MSAPYVPVQIEMIRQASNYTIVVLKGGKKRFGVYMLPTVGRAMQEAMNGKKPLRPSSHHLMHSIFKGLEVKPLQVVLWDVDDTIYSARLFLKQEKEDLEHMIEIDARPSDCLPLALMHHIPILCRQEVLDKAIHLED